MMTEVQTIPYVSQKAAPRSDTNGNLDHRVVVVVVVEVETSLANESTWILNDNEIVFAEHPSL